MKQLKLVLATTLLAASLSASAQTEAKKPYYYFRRWPTCHGKTPCRACKNCKYCKWCAKNGGTCGRCKKDTVSSNRDRN